MGNFLSSSANSNEESAKSSKNVIVKDDLNSFTNYLKSCKNVIVMSGAGISTNAGI